MPASATDRRRRHSIRMQPRWNHTRSAARPTSSRAQGLEGKEISSPSGRGRKMSLTSPLIDQAFTLIDLGRASPLLDSHPLWGLTCRALGTGQCAWRSLGKLRGDYVAHATDFLFFPSGCSLHPNALPVLVVKTAVRADGAPSCRLVREGQSRRSHFSSTLS